MTNIPSNWLIPLGSHYVISQVGIIIRQQWRHHFGQLVEEEVVHSLRNVAERATKKTNALSKPDVKE